MGLDHSAKKRADYWQKLADDCRDQLANFRMSDTARDALEADAARYEASAAAILEEEAL